MANRQPDAVEYTAWSMLKVIPAWYEELTNETVS
jgi:hypothetical protein